MRNFSVFKTRCFRIFLISSTLLSYYSCRSDRPNSAISIIDVEGAVGKGSVEKLSDYVSDIRYVPLETTDSSLVGNISKICLENGFLYIIDFSGNLKIFDKNGKFIRSINRKGRGPQEYIDIRDINIDPKSGNILILSGMGEIAEYNNLGIFIRKIASPLDGQHPINFAIIDNNHFILSTFRLTSNDGTENGYTIYDDTLKVYKQHFISLPSIVKNSSDGVSKIISIRADFPVYQYFDNEIRVASAGNDTIFTLDSKLNFTPKYIFNLGKYKEFVEENLSPGSSSEAKIITKSPVVHETADYLFIEFDFHGLAPEPYEREVSNNGRNYPPVKQTQVKGIFIKKTGVLKLLNQPFKGKTGLIEDIKGGPLFWENWISSRKELITYKNAIDILSFAESGVGVSKELKELAAVLTENDNPVVVIAK